MDEPNSMQEPQEESKNDTPGCLKSILITLAVVVGVVVVLIGGCLTLLQL